MSVGCKNSSCSFILTHIWWWTHTFLHTSCSLTHCSFHWVCVHTNTHTYTQLPSYLKYCSAIDRCCWHWPYEGLWVCVWGKPINERWGVGVSESVDVERHEGKFAIQKGVARRLWRRIFCRLGSKVTETSAKTGTVCLLLFVTCVWLSYFTINIIKNSNCGSFLISLEKMCFHQATMQSTLSQSLVWHIFG